MKLMLQTLFISAALTSASLAHAAEPMAPVHDTGGTDAPKSDEDSARPWSAGVGVGAGAVSGLLGPGPFGVLFVEGALSSRVSLIGSIAGSYQVLEDDGSVAESYFVSPGVGARLFFVGPGIVRPSAQLLAELSRSGAEASDLPSSEVTSVGVGAGVALDGEISQTVRLRLSSNVATASYNSFGDGQDNTFVGVSLIPTAAAIMAF